MESHNKLAQIFTKYNSDGKTLAEFDFLTPEEDEEQTAALTKENKLSAEDAPFKVVETEEGTQKYALAIPFSVIPQMYSAVMREFKKINTRTEKMDGDVVRSLTQTVLAVNADNYTCWNSRKVIIEQFEAENGPETDGTALAKKLQHELDFSALILSKHPKSNEAWNHRQWCVFKLQNYKQEIPFQKEFAVAQRASEKHPRNYYSWAYRHLIATLLPTWNSIQEELHSIRKWTQVHISDGSSFQYIQHLLTLLSERPHEGETTGKDEIQTEKTFLDSLLMRYPSHESMWVHRRWLCTQLWAASIDSEGTKMGVESECKQIGEIIAKYTTEALDEKETLNVVKHFKAYCLWLTHEKDFQDQSFVDRFSELLKLKK